MSNSTTNCETTHSFKLDSRNTRQSNSSLRPCVLAHGGSHAKQTRALFRHNNKGILEQKNATLSLLLRFIYRLCIWQQIRQSLSAILGFIHITDDVVMLRWFSSDSRKIVRMLFDRLWEGVTTYKSVILSNDQAEKSSSETIKPQKL